MALFADTSKSILLATGRAMETRCAEQKAEKCRRAQTVNQKLSVRNLFAEPNNPTTNSLSFWLTARRDGLAGNGQYWGNPALSSLPGLPVGLPKSPLPGLSGCASQSLRRGVRVWLTALMGDPAVIGALFFIGRTVTPGNETAEPCGWFSRKS